MNTLTITEQHRLIKSYMKEQADWSTIRWKLQRKLSNHTVAMLKAGLLFQIMSVQIKH